MDPLHEARAQISGIKRRFVEKYGWELKIDQGDGILTLYVTMRHSRTARQYTLRLIFTRSFPSEMPKETFVNPENHNQEGREFWPNDNGRAFRSDGRICIRGVYGCDNVLHRNQFNPYDRQLVETLLEIQNQIDRTAG